jgi:hypothetical protein
MRYVAKKMIAVSLSLPKVDAVFFGFVWTFGVEIFDKSKYDNFSKFKARQPR